MGFGILLIGYMFLLNISYFALTDIISAFVLIMAFYKLSSVNRYFKGGIWVCCAFAALSLFELVTALFDMFLPLSDIGALLSYAEIPRYVTIAVITALMLLGIADVADEVGLAELAKRCKLLLPVGTVIYAFLTALCIQGLDILFGIELVATLTVIFIGAELIFVLVCMYYIYKAYAKICMPDEDDGLETPSRFGFVNKFREHEAKKQREYTEYQIEKMKKRNAEKDKKNDKRRKK